MSESIQTHLEYRAVFRYPPVYGFGELDPDTGHRGIGQPPDTYGPARRTLEEAQRERPPRAEETHAWVAGIQTRTVTEQLFERRETAWRIEEWVK